MPVDGPYSNPYIDCGTDFFIWSYSRQSAFFAITFLRGGFVLGTPVVESLTNSDVQRRGLELICKRSLPQKEWPSTKILVDQTLDEFADKIDKVRSNPAGFLRTLLYNRILNFLLDGAKRGDGEAYRYLIQVLNVRFSFDPQFSNSNWKYLVDEDVLQDSFLTFCEKMEEKVESNPYLYFRQILLNKLKDKLNASKRKRTRFVEQSDPDSDETDFETHLGIHKAAIEDDYEKRTADRDLLNRILDVVSELTDFCQEFFRSIYSQADPKEWRAKASASWHMSESALNTRIHRCRSTLMNLLNERELLHG